MPVPANESCVSCTFAVSQPDPDQYICRRYPPPHPTMLGEDWCGEYVLDPNYVAPAPSKE